MYACDLMNASRSSWRSILPSAGMRRHSPFLPRTCSHQVEDISPISRFEKFDVVEVWLPLLAFVMSAYNIHDTVFADPQLGSGFRAGPQPGHTKTLDHL